MAQVKNNFIKSKMNRDLDARLIPNGEYREGRNINVSKSEGADVGAIENVRGNEAIIINFLSSLQAKLSRNEELEIIGLYTHEQTSSIYLFITSWVDNSESGLDNKFGGHNYIAQIALGSNDSYTPRLLVKGKFLNFSKSSDVLGFNIIENQLFFSDNRNQPRVINITNTYVSGNTEDEPNNATDYYYTEDQISVAKFAPYEPIKFVKNTGVKLGSIELPNWEPTWRCENEEWLPVSLTAPLSTINSADGKLFFTNSSPANVPDWPNTYPIHKFVYKDTTKTIPLWRVRNSSHPASTPFYVKKSDGFNQVVLSTDKQFNTTATIPTNWVEGDLITFQLANPEFRQTTGVAKKYIEDKFVRFSYRFKFEDNEYSLMAPFTQPLFVPKKAGGFNVGDEANAATSSNLNWFENMVSNTELNIQLPSLDYQNDPQPGLNLINRYKIKEIQILAKSSNDLNVYSIDSIELNDAILGSGPSSMILQNAYYEWPYNSQFLYKYKGNKPFEVLPESDVTRVSDSTPVRALSQEVAGNRVMYGNYLNSHGAPKSLDYECYITPKFINNPPQPDNPDFPSQTLDLVNNPPIHGSSNTVIKEYYNSTLKQGRTYQVGVVLSDRYGRQSNVILANNEYDANTTRDKSTIFAPYNDFGTDFLANFFGNSLKVAFETEIPENDSIAFYPGLYDVKTNPLGWYSYKIVVKQQEQEYYNVYLPGTLSGNVVYTKATTPLSFSDTYSVANISLIGGNVNKVPKDTSNVAGTDTSFGSDTSLFYRVLQNYYDSSNVWNNSKNPNVKEFEVVTIQQWNDFGPWTTKKGDQEAYPGGYSSTHGEQDALYNVDKNPFIATLDISAAEDQRLGFSADNQTAASANTAHFSRFLTVAETNPVISNLDIFWETSTSGLISDLNQAIRDGASNLAPTGLTTWSFSYEEKYPYDGIGLHDGSGDYFLVNNFNILTAGGLPSDSDNITIEILSVTSSGAAMSAANFAEYFIIEAINPSAVGVVKEFNLRLRSSPNSTTTTPVSIPQESFFNDAISSGLTKILMGTLSFKIKVTIQVNGVDYNATFSDGLQNLGKMSNNKPKWEWSSGNSFSDWGSAKTNPESTSSHNGYGSPTASSTLMHMPPELWQTTLDPTYPNYPNDSLANDRGYKEEFLLSGLYSDPHAVARKNISWKNIEERVSKWNNSWVNSNDTKNAKMTQLSPYFPEDPLEGTNIDIYDYKENYNKSSWTMARDMGWSMQIMNCRNPFDPKKRKGGYKKDKISLDYDPKYITPKWNPWDRNTNSINEYDFRYPDYPLGPLGPSSITWQDTGPILRESQPILYCGGFHIENAKGKIFWDDNGSSGSWTAKNNPCLYFNEHKVMGGINYGDFGTTNGYNDDLYGHDDGDNKAKIPRNFRYELCTSNGLLSFSNGSFIRSTSGVEAYVDEVESVTIKLSDLDYYKDNINEVGWHKFQTVPGGKWINATGDAGEKRLHGYDKLPFEIVKLSSAYDDWVLTKIPPSLYGVYCFMIRPWNPLFNQQGNTNIKYLHPQGTMNSKEDVVVYRARIKIKETFPGAIAADAVNEEQYVYIKLYP